MADDEHSGPGPETTPAGFPRLSLGAPPPPPEEPPAPPEEPAPRALSVVPDPPREPPAGAYEIPDPRPRRSSLESMESMESIPGPAPAPYEPTSLPGDVAPVELPATFAASPSPAPAGDGRGGAGGTLGALTMATALAVSVAALRGMYTAVTGREGKDKKSAEREAAGHRRAAERLARTTNGATGPAGGGGGRGGGRVQLPGPDRGSRSVNRSGGLDRTDRRGGGGGGRGGSGEGGGGGRRPGAQHGASGVGGRSPGGRADRSERRERHGHRSDAAGSRSGGLDRRSGDRTKLGPAARQGAVDRAAPRLDRRRDHLSPVLQKSGKVGPKPDRTKPKREETSPKRDREKVSLDKPKPSPKNRTTLAQALKQDTGESAATRWKKRRRTLDPVMRRTRAEERKKTEEKAKHTKHNPKHPGESPKPPPADAKAALPPAPKKPKTPRWKPKWRKHPTKPAAGKRPFSSRSTRGGPGGKGRAKSGWDRVRNRAHRRARAHGARHPHGDPFAGAGRRRSPYESAAHAAGGHDWTVTRADRPQPGREAAGLTTGVRMLAEAPTPHHPRPGTSRPTPPDTDPGGPAGPGGPTGRTQPVTDRPGTLATNPTRPPAPSGGTLTTTAGGHDTEVSLDAALAALESLTIDGFEAHETCRQLAQQATEIRYALDELAVDVRERHNVVGHLTAAAMARLAESMELLSARAAAMSTASLTAAELAEAADQAMNDAYRPVQQATADAGLSTPSARAHNED
ncbi:hypothetical protein [Streptomyces bohaiensis]|uniref:ATP/GTP-binding protein n=1 Tax=Streptomyces bohaiensis TaxID=1431344 RepID=A0ABX1CB35_9ACTN|nr:hypothetical protein [Streptomyces bohaiensis]NJQ13519.1 hypothetical protein [Streptomyces bohaiensis]